MSDDRLSESVLGLAASIDEGRATLVEKLRYQLPLSGAQNHLVDEVAELVAIVRDFAASDPDAHDGTGYVTCCGRRREHADTCPWRRARELLGDA